MERAFAIRRRALGLSLDRAAARLNLNPRYLRALELGRSPLSLPLAGRMAGEYACTVGDLTRPACRNPEPGAGGTGVRERRGSRRAETAGIPVSPVPSSAPREVRRKK